MLWSYFLVMQSVATSAQSCRSDSAAQRHSLLQTSPGVDDHGRPPVRKIRLRGRVNLSQCVSNYADGLEAVRPGLGAMIRQHTLQPVRVSNRQILLNAGSGGTATRSLFAALTMFNMTGYHYWSPWAKTVRNIFGLSDIGCPESHHSTTFHSWQTERRESCYNALRNMDVTTGVPDEIDFMLDTPVPHAFFDLFLAFPEAKWMLTTRPVQQWLAAPNKSWLAPVVEPCGLFTSDFDDNELGRLEDLKNDFVRCTVPPDRLLEFDVFSDPPTRLQRLMAEISVFVGRPIPDKQPLAFPNVQTFTVSEDCPNVPLNLLCNPWYRSAALLTCDAITCDAECTAALLS